MKKTAKRMSLVLALCLVCTAVISPIPAGAASSYTPEIIEGTVSYTDPHETFVLDITINCVGDKPSPRFFTFDIRLRPTVEYVPGDYDFELIFGKEMRYIQYTIECDVKYALGFTLEPVVQMRDRVEHMGHYFTLPSHHEGNWIIEYHIYGECRNIEPDYKFNSLTAISAISSEAPIHITLPRCGLYKPRFIPAYDKQRGPRASGPRLFSLRDANAAILQAEPRTGGDSIAV